MKNNVLAQGLSWFIRLRWLAAMAILTSAIFFREDPAISVSLVRSGFAILIYNAIFIWGKIKRNWSGKVFAHFQIILDWMALGYLAYLSGKAGSPLIPFFIFHVIIASVLLDRVEAYIHTSIAIGTVIALWIGSEGQSSLPWQDWSMVFVGLQLPVSLLVLVFIFFTTTYLTGTVGKLLKEREKKLESAYQKLEAEEREKTWFLLATAHSLRSPLATVESLIQSFLYTSPEDIVQKTKEVFDRVLNRTAHLSITVKDLLELASVRENKSLRIESIVLYEVMRNTIEKLKQKAAEKSLSVDIVKADKVPDIQGNREEWERVFENLVDNAIKYNTLGGSITARITVNGENVICSIQDSGIGIAQEDLAKVTREFYRAENARTYTDEGTGLGLSIVRRIVEKRGGDLRIASSIGNGTTLTLSIPIVTK